MMFWFSINERGRPRLARFHPTWIPLLFCLPLWLPPPLLAPLLPKCLTICHTHLLYSRPVMQLLWKTVGIQIRVFCSLLTQLMRTSSIFLRMTFLMWETLGAMPLWVIFPLDTRERRDSIVCFNLGTRMFMSFQIPTVGSLSFYPLPLNGKGAKRWSLCHV